MAQELIIVTTLFTASGAAATIFSTHTSHIDSKTTEVTLVFVVLGVVQLPLFKLGVRYLAAGQQRLSEIEDEFG